ncbi:cellulose binding domain-containing protein [Actinoallomurus purpureus]|uniref:cellulose binding domain-containing protein n=1 Tax=Actinoallomurus purpureus TaxID=478114 RepID=UPI0020934580|nr:cellulose binding domain-containing protein [Actinoallomurus purpureus]MCO6006283.1 cellulose binding domain-containing protein [Actinoallomurus purpureus]
MRVRPRALTILATCLLLLGVLTGPAHAAGSLTATFAKTSDWGSGYQGQFTIKNDGSSAVNGWTVAFDLPSGSSVGTYWDALETQSGSHYVFKNRDYNGSIAAGASVVFGFVASGSGTPTGCTLNGGSCDGGGGGSDTQAPSTPTGLTVTGHTSSSVSLSWTASTDNVGVTGYEVYQGSSLATTVSGTSATVSGLAASTSYSFTVRAKDAAGNSSAFSASVSATTDGGGTTPSGGLRAAPYFMPLDNDPQPISAIVSGSGVNSLVLAFVLAPNGGGCTPTWDGDAAQKVSADTAAKAQVDAVRGAGGDVAVSFGGYNGVELGAACSDASSLAQAYQQVIDKYTLTHVDFDIEGDDLGDASGETRRFQAIKILKQNAAAAGRRLEVSLTMPVTTVGLSDLDKAEIQRAKDNGADIDLYAVMAFDYGGPAASMAADVQKVMEAAHGQLVTLRPDLSAATVYARTGLILMNGHTDQPSELFTQDTFRTLLGYAQQHHLGRLSFWSLNRDRQCTGTTGWADGKCSSVTQQPYDFAKIIGQFTG